MVLYFKIDAQKKLRMLYCTNFKADQIEGEVILALVVNGGRRRMGRK